MVKVGIDRRMHSKRWDLSHRISRDDEINIDMTIRQERIEKLMTQSEFKWKESSWGILTHYIRHILNHGPPQVRW